MLVENLVEFRNFGLNWLSIIFLTTVVFTIGEGIGLFLQNLSIWKNRSGQTISNLLFIYLSSLYMSIAIYGAHLESAALIVNGMLFLLCVPILIGLRRFKGFSSIDIVVMFICAISLSIMVFGQYDKEVFSLFSLIGIFALATQAFIILKEKRTGVLDIRLVAIYGASTIFWIEYARRINDTILLVVTILTFSIIVMILFFWFFYNDHFHKKLTKSLKITYANRRKIGFDFTKEEWKHAPAYLDSQELKICGHPVMERWEEEYMKKLAEIVCSRGGVILEVGYGMGISSGYIQNHEIKSHTIIEANKQVFGNLLEFSLQARKKVIPLFGLWQEVVSHLQGNCFDGILFDTYPLSEDEIHRNHYYFFQEGQRLLKKGGVLTYYSDEVDNFSGMHIKLLNQAGFNDIRGEVCNVNPPATCLYWKDNRMLAPIIIK